MRHVNLVVIDGEEKEVGDVEEKIWKRNEEEGTCKAMEVLGYQKSDACDPLL